MVGAAIEPVDMSEGTSLSQILIAWPSSAARVALMAR